MRDGVRRSADTAQGLPSSWRFGRFPDLRTVDGAARALGAEPCVWHRLWIESLAPEGVERELADLVSLGDRACALYAVRVLHRALRQSGAGADSEARARYWLGVLTPPNRAPAATRRLRQALSPALAHGERDRVARILGQLGRVCLNQGALTDAYTRLGAAIELGEGAGGLGSTILAATCVNYGLALVMLGHPASAVHVLEKALNLALETRREDIALAARDVLRYAEEDRGNLAQGYLHASTVLTGRRRSAPPALVHRALVNLVRIAIGLDPAGDNALQLLDEARQFAGEPVYVAIALLCEADVHTSHGDVAKAVACLDRVEADLEGLEPSRRSTIAFHLAYMRADLLLALGQVAGAYEWYRVAAGILRAAPRPNIDIPAHLRSSLLAGLAAASQAVGRTDEAAALADQMERAWAPTPLPPFTPTAVARAEVAALGPSPGADDGGNVVFLPRRRR